MIFFGSSDLAKVDLMVFWRDWNVEDINSKSFKNSLSNHFWKGNTMSSHKNSFFFWVSNNFMDRKRISKIIIYHGDVSVLHKFQYGGNQNIFSLWLFQTQWDAEKFNFGWFIQFNPHFMKG
jgi:hypothetical protein